MPPARPRNEIPSGSLELLILRTLAREGERHGFEIAESIERLSRDVFAVPEGSLYPALQRMLLKGWIVGDWGKTSENRRARYYTLTAAGRREMAREMASYERVAQAIARVLAPT